jgi:hypothetical protein
VSALRALGGPGCGWSRQAGQAGSGSVRYNAAMAISITLPHEQIRAFCRKHRIRRMLLFGSVLREDFGPESDIDVLTQAQVIYEQAA